jgi:hypothetical protein
MRAFFALRNSLKPGSLQAYEAQGLTHERRELMGYAAGFRLFTLTCGMAG